MQHNWPIQNAATCRVIDTLRPWPAERCFRAPSRCFLTLRHQRAQANRTFEARPDKAGGLVQRPALNARPLSEQYLTLSQSRASFLRHVNMRPHAGPVLIGRFASAGLRPVAVFRAPFTTLSAA